MTVEINTVNITRTEVVLDGRGSRGVNGTLTVTSAAGQAVSSRVALAAIASPVNGQPAFLTEAGRDGKFVFDSSNLSAFVTADATQGFYVAPAAAPTGSSGAWVRQFSGVINPRWFGVLDTNSAGTNGTAWAAMAATLRSRAVASHTGDPTGFYRTLGIIQFPDDKTYNFSAVLDIDGGSFTIEGFGPTTRYSGTTLQWANTSSGFNVDYGNSASSGTGGTWTTFRNLRLDGGYSSGAEASRNAIQSSDRIRVEGLVFNNWAGEGISVAATSPTGNANSGYIAFNHFENCRTGLKLAGSDANNIILIGNDYSGCREWGEWHSEALSGVSIMPQTETCGIMSLNDGVTVAASVVFRTAHRYYCKQTSGASTNPPSGDTTDNTWWGYLNDLGVGSGVPTWASGGLYRRGGPIYTDNANASIIIENPYIEGGQPPISGEQGTEIHNGHMVTAPIGLCTWERNSGGDKTFDYVKINTSLKSYAVTQTFGPQSGAADLALFWDSPVGGALHTWRVAGVAKAYDYCTAAGKRGVRGETSVVTNVAGTDIVVTDATKMELQGSKAIKGTNAVAPTTGAHVQGEIVFFASPSASGKIGWVCTASGTPGTWKTWGAIDA